MSYALTSGPSQPEVQSFEPIGTTDMVDMFSGDFTYNIPLFELPGPEGGYPFNLAYHAGIGMGQEASWVGLGWNLNPGAITRQMRGLPDDFNGDQVTTDVHIKPNRTYGVKINSGLEIFGKDKDGGSESTSDSSFKALPDPSFGLSFYYNNYKGFGAGFDISANLINGGKMGLGLNFGADSQEGVSVSPSLALGSRKDGIDDRWTLGLGYNSSIGLTSLSLNRTKSAASGLQSKLKGMRTFLRRTTGRETGSTSMQLLTNSLGSHVPSVKLPMGGSNWDVKVRGGAGMSGFFGHGSIAGYYNVQKIRGSDGGSRKFKYPAYGMMNMQHLEDDAMRDFNRERDGAVSYASPNLAIPTMSYDVFNTTAQGMAGTFRAHRSEIGILNDQNIESKSISFALGADVGVPLHIGVNLTYGEATEKARAWEKKNDLDGFYGFRDFDASNPTFEPTYFRMSGEAFPESLDIMKGIGGKNPVRIHLSGALEIPGLTFGGLVDNFIGNATATKELVTDQILGIGGEIIRPETKTFGGEMTSKRTERKPRANAMQPILNEQLKPTESAEEALGLFNVSYRDTNGSMKKVDRLSGKRGKHIGGFSTTGANGMRYVYALPAYNKKQVECQFSVNKTTACTPTVDVPLDLILGKRYKVNKTNEYLNRVEMPEFAYTHLLTSVVGSDYVDADDIPGPSSGDLGYWIKFNYKKTSDEYQWRAPFFGANYNPGMLNRKADDLASYMYGVKEIYYLESVESKSHIALFETEGREDGRGAKDEFQNHPGTIAEIHLGDRQHKLKLIRLFTKVEYENLGENGLQSKKLSSVIVLTTNSVQA